MMAWHSLTFISFEANEHLLSAVFCRLLVVAAWHSLNAALAARVVLRISRVCMTLNPVSSGLVVIA